MKIVVTGSTGFVGTHLCRALLAKGYRVTGTGMRPERKAIRDEKFQYIRTDTTLAGPWQEALDDADAVVNLAGRTIFHLWNDAYKAKIYDSRILTTRRIVEALPSDRPVTICNASAAGFYGTRNDDVLTEAEPVGDDFLARVCLDWEAEAFKAQTGGHRVAAARLGVVLGKGGGAMEKMIPAFRMCLGGPVGTGNQWFPWIHIEDLAAAVMMVLEQPGISGPLNFTGPEPIRNRDLTSTLAKALNRPAIMPAPEFMLRRILGEFGQSLMASQRAVPEKLLASGFEFTYPRIQDAISEIVR